MNSNVYKVNQSKHSFANLILIDVKKENHAASLIFDTGASISVINESTAKKFGVKSKDESITAGGTAGNIMQMNLSIVQDFNLGNHKIDALDVIVVEDERLYFGVDETGQVLKCDGVLGWDVIADYKWTFDANESLFTFMKSINEDQNHTSMEEWDNMPIIKTIYEKEALVFGFDTGHTESVLGKALYPRFKDQKTELDTFTGLDGESEEEVKLVDSFKFQIGSNPINLTNISLVNRDVFPSSRQDIGGLLGMDILEGKSWILDYANRRFEIR